MTTKMHDGRFWKYWGKADTKGSLLYHPLAYHCLDVAACGTALLQVRPAGLRILSSVSGIPEFHLKSWITFLLAIHDVGKFSDSFQKAVPELFDKLQSRKTRASSSERHDVLGFYFCKSMFPEWACKKYPKISMDAVTLRDHMQPWLAAVTGHHGHPPSSVTLGGPLLDEQFPETVEKDILLFWEELAGLMLPQEVPFISGEDGERFYGTFPKASWLMAGLAVVSDWLGSNRNWFPYEETSEVSLTDYWKQRALPQAQKAVQESGLGRVFPSTFRGLRSLFPSIHTPTDLQFLAETMEIKDGQHLFIMEEVTGGGKTEAAVVLSHRLMEKGLADGIFMALPTMATANAMHERVQRFYRELFDCDKSLPSFILSHSMARMKMGLEDRNKPDGGYGGDDNPSASQTCSLWLSDSRKKALLADVGVGTIDQVLLSVLPVRHQSLRLLGLSRKILLVDEVHACDSYVFRLLCYLLRFHASWGGSAILLSATLPKEMRAQLLSAYAEGAGWPEGPSPEKADYPLLTQLSSMGLREIPFKANERMVRRVRVEWMREESDVWKRLETALNRGQCACWVRNTVVDAVGAYEKALKTFGKDKIHLFHARFTIGDRLEKEQAMINDFGPDGGREKRAGRLVISTQVVEQSLDLDFDYMVSDLAPADLIIQRSGRLRRHPRDADGNHTDGSDQRGEVVMGVWMPEAGEKAQKGWYSALFPKGQYVYAHHGRLWLTAHWLQKQHGFSIPGDFRDIMEFVYGPDALERLPKALGDIEMAQEGEDKGESSLAGFNALSLDGGYFSADTKWDDTNAPTRLGQPTTIVRLARPKGNGWGPWRDGDRNGWELSQLSVRRALVAEEHPETKIIAAELRKLMADEGRYCVIIPLHEKDGPWMGKALNKDRKPVVVEYGTDLGFRLLKDDGE